MRIATPIAGFSAALRSELRARNFAFAKKHELAHKESYGSAPVIVYEPFGEPERHGNFFEASYSALPANPNWAKRLEKIHPQGRTSLPKSERRWRELDSSMSSDALLLNVFCCPGTLNWGVRSLLGVDDESRPEFGVKARVPLTSGRFDRTEVDMRIGSLLVEAKLTESDFQQKSKPVLEGYRDFRITFDRKLLPQTKDTYLAYQLIRNVLAASAMECSFCVLLDERRPDLREQWYAVMRAVRSADLRVRCKVLTWQELSEALPDDLSVFLDEKYGIVPPGRVASQYGQPTPD
jgi:restriction endonuclease-like protein